MAFDYRTEYQRYKKYYLNLRRFYQKPVAKVSVFVVISFMTVSFFSLFAIRPTLITISKLVKEIEDKGEIDQKLEQKLVDLARAQAEYGQIQNEIPIIWRAIPEQPEIARLILELEVAALQYQVQLVNLQVEPVVLIGPVKRKDKQSLPEAKFSVTVGGNFDQVRQFMAAIGNLERVMVINEVDLAQGTPLLQQEGVRVTATLRGQVQFEPQGG